MAAALRASVHDCCSSHATPPSVAAKAVDELASASAVTRRPGCQRGPYKYRHGGSAPALSSCTTRPCAVPSHSCDAPVSGWRAPVRIALMLAYGSPPSPLTRAQLPLLALRVFRATSVPARRSPPPVVVSKASAETGPSSTPPAPKSGLSRSMTVVHSQLRMAPPPVSSHSLSALPAATVLPCAASAVTGSSEGPPPPSSRSQLPLPPEGPAVQRNSPRPPATKVAAS